MQQLIKEGYNVNENHLYAYPSTPLLYAISKGDLQSVQLLLENCANPNLKAEQGTTPLEEAIIKGDTTILNHLLEHGTDISLEENMDARLALEFATDCVPLNKDVVEVLLKHGADPQSNSCRPVINAIQNYNYEIVRCLLAYSVDVDSCMPKLKRQAQHMRNIAHADSVQVLKIIKLLDEYTIEKVDLPN